MLKIAIFATALFAGASAACADGWRNDYARQDQSQAGYGYGNGTSALGRYCPAGQYPHSWPDGGWRCQYADGNFSGAGRF